VVEEVVASPQHVEVVRDFFRVGDMSCILEGFCT
jgi:hypothetical protein